MDMSVGRLTAVRGERRIRVQSGAIAGFLSGACVIAVPPGLWELAFSSIGLSEFVPVLAPPVGWPVRIVLALGAAVMAALLSGGAGRDGNPAEGRGAGRQGTTIMGWTQSLGLHHLARLARGGAEAVDHRVAITPAMRAPRMRRSAQDKVQESLARRRADMHPDAPPRAPLMASRDLPVVTELTVVENSPEAVFSPEPLPPIATPIRDTTDKVRPRPLPRAPEPLSDSDLKWVRGLLDTDEGAVSNAPLSSILPEVKAETVSADDSLIAMLGRFEQGVAQRIAVRDSVDAQARIEDSIANPSAAVEAPVVAERPITDDVGVDEALSAALETLKKLSAKANGR